MASVLSAKPNVGREAVAAPSRARRARASDGPSFPTYLLRALIWGPAAGLVLSAFVVTGGIALFLVPLAGLFYAVFCWIAWQGPGKEGGPHGE